MTNAAYDLANSAPGRYAGEHVAAPSAPVCPLCRSEDTSHAFRDNGCDLRNCRSCEIFFVHPYPASNRQHSEVASGKSAAIELLDCRRRYDGERLYYDRHFWAIAAQCRGARSILDVGCGTGQLLERFGAFPEMFRLGIELNPHAARFARRTAGCDILELPFEQFRGERKFDVITLINVFSHIPSFDGLFRSLQSALAPGGKVIFRTSEMARRVSRWNQVHWGLPDDLHFLGLGTIDHLCARYGYKIAHHARQPFEEELFRVSRWRQMGRSGWLNAAKRVAISTPGALRALSTAYSAALGRRLFVSFIVLQAAHEADQVPARDPQ